MVHAQTITKISDKRQQIIDTAKNIILGKGFAAVGLNEILTTASVPKGSFYHYFKSKEQFGDAMLENYFDTYLEQLEIALSAARGSVKARLLEYFNVWLLSQTSDTTHDKCLVVKLSAEVTDLSEAMRMTLKHGTDRVINRIAVCVQEGIDHGELPAHLDAKFVTNEIYYMWVGATLLTKVQHSREPLECAMASMKNRLSI
ncbi:MAG: TetR/AcrR family transcriptional regulator [Bacteroidia bacterium]|nr:TetR/AcrR family transcriptional regulator [Methylotenera sp.]